MWNFWGMGWGMWFWLLILIGVGYLFYLSYRPPRTYRMEREDPLEVARIRLARGEITSEEFEEIRKTLEKTR
jgi:putative membrane protein